LIPNIGPLEIGILLVIALLVFGPKRLPELGGSLGRGIRSFRSAFDRDELSDGAQKAAESSTSRPPSAIER
jgi:sec-independent protein translocase protein TatA